MTVRGAVFLGVGSMVGHDLEAARTDGRPRSRVVSDPRPRS